MEVSDNYNNETANFVYHTDVFSKSYYNTILKYLEMKSYKGGKKKNEIKIDREQLWYEINKNYFCKIWKERYPRWESEEYDYFLLNLQNKISKKFDVEVNSCLINKYKDGNDIIAPHKDNNISFGEYPTIIIYSLGCTRNIVIKNDITSKKLKFVLESNSVFIMSGSSQKYYTHEIPKDTSVDSRYSMTFRKYLS
uniref:2OG-Fe(II) oxygenase superfamily protein n=1 Tax=Megaviridae environmental sample TaxID=1737588 RepID=A0A5J6VJ95_9VIRU|nr:MAG: 2OG-Fe(II) oxygenase superfamily protein [Megaviridae environmental sample]